MADDVQYQNAVLATPASGVVVSTDEDSSGAHIQRVKIAYSADGSRVHSQVDADGVLVNLGPNNDVTVTGSVDVTDDATRDLGKVDVASLDQYTPVAGRLPVDGSGVTQPISAAALPLPTGASTAANQTTIIGHLDGVEGLLTTIDADTSTLAGAVAGTEMQVDVISMPAVSGSVTADTELPAAAALADNAANPTAPAVGSFGMVWDGVTWDRAKGNSTDGTLVDLGLNNDVTVTGTVTANLAAGTNNIGDVDVLSVIPGTAATNLGKAEDAGHSSGDTGVMVLAVRKDAAGTLVDTDADYAPLQLDSSGYLRVNVAAGGAGDGAIQDGANSAIEATVLDYTNSNPLAVRLTDTNGDYVGAGAGTQYTEDDAAAANPVGTAQILVRQDTPATLVTTDGDNVARRGTNYGAAYTQVVTSAGAFVDSFGGGTQYDEDTAAGAADKITMAGAVRKDTAASLVDTDGDRTEIQVDGSGRLWVNNSGVTQPISAASLPLPTGAATSANQTTIIGHVDGIEALLTTIDADTSTLAGAVAGTEMQVDVLTMPTTTVQATDLDIRDLTSVSDSVTAVGPAAHDAAASGNPLLLGAEFDDTLPDSVDEGDIGKLRISANRNLYATIRDAAGNERGLNVDASGNIGVTDAGGVLTVDGTVNAAQSGTWNINNVSGTVSLPTGASTLAEQQTQTTALQLIDDTVATVASAIPAKGIAVAGTDGTNARILKTDTGGELQIDVLSIAAGTNNIGDVDVLSIVPGTGATNLGKAEDGAHTTGDVGVMVLGVRTDSPDTARADANADYVPISVSSTGAVRIAPISEDFAVLANGPQVKRYYTSAGAVTDGIVWTPAAGKRWYVTDIFINVSAAATVTLEDDLGAGDSAVWKAELAANSGWSHSFNTPLFSGEDAADLIVTTTAGNIYITVTGYEI